MAVSPSLDETLERQTYTTAATHRPVPHATIFLTYPALLDPTSTFPLLLEALLCHTHRPYTEVYDTL